MKVKWGVIGAAGIADRRTIPGLLLADNAELLAVMDADEQAAERVREKYDVKYSYGHEADLLGNEEIQAVYIASPVVYHAAQVRAAADAGKHILAEKPLALSSAEAENLVSHCRGRNVLLATGFMMRFAAYHQKMRELLAQKALGDIVSVSGQFTCWYPDIAGAWRQYKDQAGGGALMDMGVHLIDLLQYLMDSKIIRVAALHGTKTFHYEVDDSSSLLAEFENGAFGNINSNFNIPDEAAKWRIEFYGTKGRMIGDETIGQAEGGKLEVLIADETKGYDAAQDKVTAQKDDVDVELGNMYAKEIASFSRSILEGTPVECPGSAAVQVQRVIEAAYKSSAEGVFVNIPA